MPPILTGEKVVKKYGDLLAVDGVDFSINAGEFFGFLGPNGAGKTSIMKMIQCFSPLTSGRITVNGKEAGRDDREIKAMLGVAPQDDNLDHELTVSENLETYARYFDIPSGRARESALRLLRFFHLEEKQDTQIRSLSGGMRKRLTIARALINDPGILILDEPTTGLDPQARHVIWRKLESLKDEGVTIILTTHYMEEATRLCDTIAIMDRGRILVVGKPSELVRSAIGENIVEVTAGDESMGRVQEVLSRAGVDYERTPEAFLVFTSAPEDVLAGLSSLGGAKAEARKPTLEDLFLKITGHELRGGE